MAEEAEEKAVAEPEQPHATEPVALATILLMSSGMDVTAENIGKILSAANVESDGGYSGVFEKASARGVDSFKLIEEFGKGGFGGGGAAADAGGAADAAPAQAEEPEEESEEEESAAGPGLFGDDSSSEESSSD